MRPLGLFFVSLMFTLFAGAAFAQAPTAAGTIIENTATGSFIPEGTTRSETVESNTVTTEVLPVYNINIEPDANGTLGTVTQGDGTEPGDPGSADGSGEPTAADDNDFASTPGQSEAADAGEQVVLEYSLENLSNEESDILLEVVQDTTDDYNLQNVTIYEDTNNDGIFDPAVDQVVTGPVTLPPSDGVPGSGDDYQEYFVVGTIPAGQPGGDEALVDLVATNQTADNNGATTDPVDDSYQVYENNNIASVTVNEAAEIGIAKELTSGPTSNGDGTFDATFTYTVENFGNVELSNIVITDDFEGIFGAGATTVLSGTDGSSLTYDPAYDGTATSNMVSGGTLAPGATDAITVTVRFDLANLNPAPDASNNYSVDYDNIANVTAETPNGTPVTDDDGSTDGTDPDPDGNDNPNDPNPEDNVPTNVPFQVQPAIAMVKSADVVLDDGNAPTYRVAYTVFVENIGDVPLTNVEVTDDLIRAFTELDTGTPVAASNISIDTAPTVQYVTTGNTNPAEGDEAVANTAFTGTGDNVLASAGTGTFDPGEQFSVSFVVLVTPRDDAGNLLDGPFNNQADVTSTDPSGNPVEDASDNGSSFDDIDPNDDGLGNEHNTPYDDNGDGTTDPDEGVVPDDGTIGNGTTENENDPTPVNLLEDPSIGIAKQVGTVTDLGDGSFNVPFTLTVENLGNVALSNVQVTDDLTATFPAPATFNIVSGTLTSADFTVNPAYDGSSDINLLAGTDTLNTNTTSTISFTVRLRPNGGTGTGPNGEYLNEATASGDSPLGNTVTDDSTNGTDPDGTDGDNTPDENVPTPVPLPEVAEIGVAKEAAVSANVGTTADPLFNVTYTIRVENLGNVNIDNVQVTDDLEQTFGNALSYSVTQQPTVSSGKALTTSTSYTGTAPNDGLLAGTDTLEPGEFSVLRFTVQVAPGSNFGPYNNQAVATGDNTGPSGGTVTDDSNNGSQVDPDGDGLANEQDTPYDENGDGVIDPNEGLEPDVPGDDIGDDTTQDNNIPTPVQFPEVSDVRLLKDAYVYNSNPTSCDQATAGDAANALPNGEDRFTDSSTGDAADLDTFAQPGEYICYTVTADNTGAATITQLEIEDAPPVPTLFVVSPANGATSDDPSLTDIECSIDNGATFAACDSFDTDGSGIVGDNGEAPITNVQLAQNPTLTQGQSATLTFVVYIP